MRKPVHCLRLLSIQGLLAIWLIGAPPVAAQELKVTLLGTGDPAPVLDRFGPSIMVEAGAEKLLFDVGRGAAQRLAQRDRSTADLTGVFFTHLHSDHVIGLPDLWLTGWLMSRRPIPLELYGPAGTAAMAGHLAEAYRFDVNIRIRDNRLPPEGGRLTAHDIAPGPVLIRNGVTVTAFSVDHGLVKPALGYRIDYAGHVVVLSGDTRFAPTVVNASRGADVLIHCVAAASEQELTTSQELRMVLARLATPQEAAEVFREAEPTLAVYSHITLFSQLTPDDLLRMTRAAYTGWVVVGEDLMSIRVGDTIRIDRPHN